MNKINKNTQAHTQNSLPPPPWIQQTSDRIREISFGSTFSQEQTENVLNGRRHHKGGDIKQPLFCPVFFILVIF